MEKLMSTGGGNSIETKEEKEFTVEEIRQLLKGIDGKERLNLKIENEIRNFKKELLAVIFSNVKEEGLEISYLLTLPGQRYKPDETKKWKNEDTVLTRDYNIVDEETNKVVDVEFSETLARYIDGKWVVEKK